MAAAAPVVIIGAGGHAVSVFEAVSALGLKVSYFVSEENPGGTLLGIPVNEALDASHARDGGLVVLAIGDNYTRAHVWERVSQTFSSEQLPAIVHPSAVIAASARIAPGSVILQGSTLGAMSQVAEGGLVNTRASLDHESILGKFSSLAPGVTTGGRVTIGDGSAISLGTCVKQGVSIGDNTVVGASSYVNADLPPRVLAYGVPARVIRPRAPDEPYLG